jgi:hypothetical protein
MSVASSAIDSFLNSMQESMYTAEGGGSIDADAQAWIDAGASAPSANADSLLQALKAVSFTSSNAFADIKAAGGTIQLYRGLTAGGATIPDVTGNTTATPANSPTFAQASGYTLNGTNQSIDSGYTNIQTPDGFWILFCNHVAFTSNDGLMSDKDATTNSFDMIQRSSTGNKFRSTITGTDAGTDLRDNTAAYSTGVDYQIGVLLASQSFRPYSNIVSAATFTTDGSARSLGGVDMRAADGTMKLGRSNTTYANIEVHAFVAAPLAPSAVQLQNLVDAIEVFWT